MPTLPLRTGFHGLARRPWLLLALAVLGCSAPPSPAGEAAPPPAGSGPAGEPYGAAAPPSWPTLVGKSWRLVEMTPGEPMAAEPPITLAIEGERVAGSGGCNQYFGAVTSPAPGEIHIGNLGRTKRACMDGTIMETEGRYMDALGGVSRYRLEGGRLLLEGRPEAAATPRRLVFEPMAAPERAGSALR